MDAEKIDLMMRMLPDGVSRRDFLRTAAAGAAGAAGPLALPKRGGRRPPRRAARSSTAWKGRPTSWTRRPPAAGSPTG